MKNTISISTKSINRFLIFIILVGSVLVDLLNGYFNYYLSYAFPIGVLFRLLVTVFLFSFLFITVRGTLLRLYIFSIIVIWFFFQLVWLNNGGYNIGRELSQFIKILYPLLLALYFMYSIRHNFIDFNDLLKWGSLNVLIAAVFIIFSFVTGIGLSTYGNGETTYGFGSSSFFKAQNDISLSMLMGFCFCIYFLFTQKKFFNYVSAFLTLLGLILIGTRSGMIGGLLIVIFFVAQMILFGETKTSFALLKKFLYTLVAITGLILCSYFVYLKIKDKPYMVNRYIEIITNPPRAKLEEAADMYIDHRRSLSSVFGPGAGEYRTKLYGNLESKKDSMDADEGKDAEKDVTDMIGAYGIILGFWIIAFPVIACFVVVRNYVKHPYSYLHFSIALCMFIFIGHSIVAGHGIKNPAVGSILSIVYVFIFSSPLPVKKTNLLRS